MNIKKILLLPCRVPALILLQALKDVATLHYEKQWVVEVSKKNIVSYVCQCEKAGKIRTVTGVSIKVEEAIVPGQLYGKIEIELTVTGLINTTLAARTFLADFDKFGNGIVAALEEHRGKRFNVHDHGEQHLAVN